VEKWPLALEETARSSAGRVQVETTQVAVPVPVPVGSPGGQEVVAAHGPEQALEIGVGEPGSVAFDAIEPGLTNAGASCRTVGGRVCPDGEAAGLVDELDGAGHVQEAGGDEGGPVVADEPVEGLCDGADMPGGVHDAGEMGTGQGADMGTGLLDDGVELHGDTEGGQRSIISCMRTCGLPGPGPVYSSGPAAERPGR
jgi:hypothetical protein